MTTPAPDPHYVLTIACPDRPGIVHAVTGLLITHEGNILESQQFDDLHENRFFKRVRFSVPTGRVTVESLREEFRVIAERFAMTFDLWDASVPYRTLILVSKLGHCLNDLLFRWGNGG